MKNCNLIFLFITLASLMLDAHCELSEKELEDIENDMVISLGKFKKSRKEEERIRSKLCARNLKAKEWEKISTYCFNQSMAGSGCKKCKEVFARSFEFCNKKVQQTDGCNEITFNKRGACQIEVFEKYREETLIAYKENKDDFMNLMKAINECWEKYDEILKS